MARRPKRSRDAHVERGRRGTRPSAWHRSRQDELAPLLVRQPQHDRVVALAELEAVGELERATSSALGAAPELEPDVDRSRPRSPARGRARRAASSPGSARAASRRRATTANGRGERRRAPAAGRRARRAARVAASPAYAPSFGDAERVTSSGAGRSSAAGVGTVSSDSRTTSSRPHALHPQLGPQREPVGEGRHGDRLHVVGRDEVAAGERGAAAGELEQRERAARARADLHRARWRASRRRCRPCTSRPASETWTCSIARCISSSPAAVDDARRARARPPRARARRSSSAHSSSRSG